MLRPPSIVVDAISQIKSPISPPAIFWPTILAFDCADSADSTRFPDLSAILARDGADVAEPLTSFVKAACSAQKRILVLDDFLFRPKENQALQIRLDQVLKWLPLNIAAKDVRFLTKQLATKSDEANLADKISEHAELINLYLPPGSAPISIQVRFTLARNFDYVHDRFAIIDDELWHFGATVGGLHHQVNAATRGWPAEQHHADLFFETAWAAEGKVGKRGRRA